MLTALCIDVDFKDVTTLIYFEFELAQLKEHMTLLGVYVALMDCPAESRDLVIFVLIDNSQTKPITLPLAHVHGVINTALEIPPHDKR